MTPAQRKPITEWDTYITFADRYHWTPKQVGALPAEFVEAIVEFWEAEHEHAIEIAKKHEHRGS